MRCSCPEKEGLFTCLRADMASWHTAEGAQSWWLWGWGHLHSVLSHVQSDCVWEWQDLRCAIAARTRTWHVLYPSAKLRKLGTGWGPLCPLRWVVCLNLGPLWLVEQSGHCNHLNHDENKLCILCIQNCAPTFAHPYILKCFLLSHSI